MLNYPAIYFLIAMGSAGLAFSGTATGSVETVCALFVLFLLASLISALVPRRLSRQIPYGQMEDACAELKRA
ncbi:hypothetical protein BH09VER1_BH09VER1_22340 [soil metagenome]